MVFVASRFAPTESFSENVYAFAAPDVVAQLDSQGMEPLATQPEEWDGYLKAELARYTKIIRDANIKPE